MTKAPITIPPQPPPLPPQQVTQTVTTTAVAIAGSARAKEDQTTVNLDTEELGKEAGANG
jgi:hypothetical protein